MQLRLLLLASALAPCVLGVLGCAERQEGSPGGATDTLSADMPATDTLAVLTLNIWHDQRDWPTRQGWILEEVRALGPDVICLQEVLQHEELPNQAETLADSLGYATFFASVSPPDRPRRYGNAILTRGPLLGAGQHALAPPDDYRVAARARTSFGEGAVSVFCTHLHYSGPTGGQEVRGTQLRDLLTFVDSTRGSDPVVLAGDFNTPPGAPELAVLDARFEDAYAVTHPAGDAEGPTTLNPAYGHSPRRIDYLFASPDLRPVTTTIVLDAPRSDSLWPSDHFGVYGRYVPAGTAR